MAIKGDKSIKIINFGDVMFDRGVRNIMENKGRDPFEYVKRDLNLLKDFDFIIANLEGPIVEMNRKKCQQKAYNFQFASTTPNLLKSIGINMVNIANNHSFDCYRVGFESTKKYLQNANIDYIGDVGPEKSFIVKEVYGKKIAFIGIDYTVFMYPIADFYPIIKKLDSENDFVVVNIHWGTEYLLKETKTQEGIAHKLIDNGADVVFGHHPHVVEPIKVYKNKPIFYSLGNFVFDQTGKDQTVGIGGAVYMEDSVFKIEVLPYNIKVFAPEFMKGDEKQQFCQKFLKDFENKDCSFSLSQVEKV
jgi:poly-gamma-glutamate synthesis protein (capsule biosynthesis protein)